MTYTQASIQSVLGGLLKNRQLVAGMRRVMVLSLWDQVVGEGLARRSWAEKIENGVLHVGVSTHAWAQELQLHKEEILTRYRQLLGRSALKDIEFRVTRRKARTPDEAALGPIILHPVPDDPLPPITQADDILASVDNPAVRDLLGPSFARLRAERQWKQEHGWVRCGQCHRIFHGEACPHCGTPLEIRCG